MSNNICDCGYGDPLEVSGIEVASFLIEAGLFLAEVKTTFICLLSRQRVLVKVQVGEARYEVSFHQDDCTPKK
jgi:hypothetical protein